MLVLWWWTIIPLLGGKEIDLNTYKQDLSVWRQRYSIFNAQAFRYHPAWRHRYLECSCYLYAIAFTQAHNIGDLIMIVEPGVGMVHVCVSIKKHYIDFSGFTDIAKVIRCYALKTCHVVPYIPNNHPCTSWRHHFFGEIFVLRHCIRLWTKTR